MKHRAVFPMQIAKYGTIAISIFYLLFATNCIFNSNIPISFLKTVLGSSFLMFGTIKLIGYFSKDLFRLAFQYDLPFGIFLFGLGLLILLKNQISSSLLWLGYGFSRIMDCLCKIKITFDAKHFGIEQWTIILILTILSGISGLALILCYRTEIDFLLLSITLILEGILNVGVMLTMVKIIRYQQPDEQSK